MRILAAALVGSLLLGFKPAFADPQWDPSVLDERIPGGLNAVEASYRQCLETALMPLHTVASPELDPKYLAGEILAQCEGNLQPIIDAASALQVPPSNIERFLQMKRSKAELSLLRSMYFESAQPAP